MTQKVVLDNLAKWLDPDSKNDKKIAVSEDTEEITVTKDAEEIAAALRADGYCHGFSVARALMYKVIGKGEWWDAAVKLVANWDGDRSNLTEIVTLPGEDQPATRAQIFERVLNYVVALQDTPDDAHMLPFHLKDIKQNTLLNPTLAPGASNPASDIVPTLADFLPLSKNSEPEKKLENFEPEKKTAAINPIKGRTKKVSVFSRDELCNELNEKFIEENLLLIHSANHTIQIDYDKEQKLWILYDPNYDHNVDDDTPIYKIFATKEALVEEIFECMGNTCNLALDALALGDGIEAPFKLFDIKTKLEALSQNEILILMANYAPEQLQTVLEVAKQETAVCNALAQALVSKSKSKINQSGLQIMVHHAPASLAALLDLARSNLKSEIHLALAQALTSQNSVGWSGLQSIACFAPGFLAALFDLTRSNPKSEIYQAFAQALVCQNSDRWSGLQSIVCFVPGFLTALIELARDKEKNSDIRSALVKALTIQDNSNESGLQFIIRLEPGSLDALIDLAEDNDKIHSEFVFALFHAALKPLKNEDPKVLCSALAKVLLKKDSQKNSGLQRIVLSLTNYLGDLIELAGQNFDIYQNLACALSMKNCYGSNGLQAIAESALSFLSPLIKLACHKDSGSLRKVLLEILNNQDGESWSVLKLMAYDSQADLNELIKLLAFDKSLLTDFLKMLASEDNQGKTGWYVINDCLPKSRETILSNLSAAIEQLDKAALLEVAEELTDALTNDESPYRGLCKERHSSFRREPYGKTAIWQHLMEGVQQRLAMELNKKGEESLTLEEKERALNILKIKPERFLSLSFFTRHRQLFSNQELVIQAEPKASIPSLVRKE